VHVDIPRKASAPGSLRRIESPFSLGCDDAARSQVTVETRLRSM